MTVYFKRTTGMAHLRATLLLCFNRMVSGEFEQFVVQELKEMSLWSGIALVVLVITYRTSLTEGRKPAEILT